VLHIPPHGPRTDSITCCPSNENFCHDYETVYTVWETTTREVNNNHCVGDYHTWGKQWPLIQALHCDWLQHFCHRTKYAKLVAGIFYYSTCFKSPGTSANNHFIAAFNTRPKSQPAGGYYFRLQHVGLSVCGCVSSSFRVKWSNLLQIKTEILLLPRYMFNFERSKVSNAKMPKWNQDVSHRSLYHLFHCGLGHGKRSLHVGAQRSRSPLQIGRFT